MRLYLDSREVNMDLSKIIMYCPHCNKELGNLALENWMKYYRNRILTKRGMRTRLFCDKKCYENYLKQFEITYKGVTMYKIVWEDKTYYLPYWDCPYCFDSEELCYNRMTAQKHIAYFKF
jgi:hypothetical protein